MKEFVKKLIGRLEEGIFSKDERLEYDTKTQEHLISQNKGIRYAIKIVNELAEEYKGGWIPCSERLPEERDWCLAVFREGDSDFVLVPRVAEYIGKETVCTTNEGWLIIDLEDEIGINAYYKKLKCLAWQPLPAPYKEEGGKNE